MSTRVTFDIDSDDETLRTAVADIKNDPVMVWRLAVFCSQMQLEKAIARQSIRHHYDEIHMRARATREAKRRSATDSKETPQ